jgi:hypothetical protein
VFSRIRIRNIFTYLLVSFPFLSISSPASYAGAVLPFPGSAKSASTLSLQQFLCPDQLFRDAFVPDCAFTELELFRDSLPDFFELFDACAITNPAQCRRLERTFAVVGGKKKNQTAIDASFCRRELNEVDINQKRIALQLHIFNLHLYSINQTSNIKNQTFGIRLWRMTSLILHFAF